jgi:hypothetical protein
MDKVDKSIGSECYTPSSELFIVYEIAVLEGMVSCWRESLRVDSMNGRMTIF